MDQCHQTIDEDEEEQDTIIEWGYWMMKEDKEDLEKTNKDRLWRQIKLKMELEKTKTAVRFGSLLYTVMSHTQLKAVW